MNEAFTGHCAATKIEGNGGSVHRGAERDLLPPAGSPIAPHHDATAFLSVPATDVDASANACDSSGLAPCSSETSLAQSGHEGAFAGLRNATLNGASNGHCVATKIEGNGEPVHRSAVLDLLPPADFEGSPGPLEPSLTTVFLGGEKHVVDASDSAVRAAIEYLLRAKPLPS